MVYLGGMGSITGSIVGATLWQILIQTLKNLGTWRWVVGGGLLCVIMIFLTNGIFGNKELSDAIHAIRKYFSRSKTNKTISEETTK